MVVSSFGPGGVCVDRITMKMSTVELAFIEICRVLAKGRVAKYVLMKPVESMTYFATSGALIEAELREAIEKYQQARQRSPGGSLRYLRQNTNITSCKAILASEEYQKGWKEQKTTQPLWAQFLSGHIETIKHIYQILDISTANLE